MRNYKISLILNTIIVILTVLATTIMFTGIKFMHGYDPVLESTTIGMFKFFTVDSNLLMGITSLIFIIEEIKYKNIELISKKIYILKLMATTAVSLTFITVFLYLGPIAEHGIPSMLMNSNLFYHLLIPLLSIITFTLFEKTDKIKYKYSFYGVVPTLLYAIYYLINVLTHIENGKVSPDYDWYWFVQNGLWTSIIVLPLMLIITYIISILLWKINKKNI